MASQGLTRARDSKINDVENIRCGGNDYSEGFTQRLKWKHKVRIMQR